MKTEQRDVYKLLPAAGAQRTITCLGDAWSSYWEASSDFKVNPGKYNGKPNIPGYSKKSKTYVVSRNGFRVNDGMLQLSGGTKFGFAPIKINCCTDQLFSSKASETIVADVRIVPKGTSFVIEIVHKENTGEPITLDPSKMFSVDLGVNNLLAIISNQPDYRPVLVGGGSLKALNAKWNKDKAELTANGKRKSYEERKEDRKVQREKAVVYNRMIADGASQEEAKQVFARPANEARIGNCKARHIASKTMKRDNSMRDYMHKVSHWLIQECVRTDTGTIVIGHSKDWKNGVNIGAVNNQKFVSIPHAKLIGMIRYKAERYGIKVIVREESYTSKASALDMDEIPTYGELPKGEPKPVFSGRRVHRGLYRSRSGRTINADINGAINILRKEVGDTWLQGQVEAGKGVMDMPVRWRHIATALEGGPRASESRLKFRRSSSYCAE